MSETDDNVVCVFNCGGVTAAVPFSVTVQNPEKAACTDAACIYILCNDLRCRCENIFTGLSLHTHSVDSGQAVYNTGA